MLSKLNIAAALVALVLLIAYYRTEQSTSRAPLLSLAAPQSVGAPEPVTSDPESESEDPAVTSTLAKLSAALVAPGLLESYPSPEIQLALIELGAKRTNALPILRKALHHSDWETRRRAAYTLACLKLFSNSARNEIREALPDVIEMLRDCQTVADLFAARAALEATGIDVNSIPDLINIMRDNSEVRSLLSGLMNT